MDPHFDLAKFVGAASAPVALIIATSIIVSNLGGRYAVLAGFFRGATAELRDAGGRNSPRAPEIVKELSLLKRRLRLLILATTWLLSSIVMFTATVIFTGVAMLLPKAGVFTALVVFFSFAGATMLVVAVVISIMENIDSGRATKLE
jgi:hypothetical protein